MTMKRILFIILVLFSVVKGDAQINYVLNPSFEEYSACPNSLDQINLATHWTSLDTLVSFDSFYYYGTCAGEYCNACADVGGVGVPIGSWYYQYAHSGNGMVQAVMCNVDNSDYLEGRDYTHGHLSKSLRVGIQYCVSFYVVREQQSVFAINNIGAYLDDGSINIGNYYCGSPQTAYVPQVMETDIITDTLYWTKVQGSFIANGTERFITIGNFKDNEHTDTLNMHYGTSEFSLYLIDDVSVIESDNVPFAGNDTSIVAGDSVFLGPHEIALPYTWYVEGNPVAIDSGGGVWVHPAGTTTYVLEQNLCGELRYDTVVVYDTGCPAPLPAFVYTGMDTVTFTYTGTGAKDSMSWSFGDGGTSDSLSPTHIYPAVADSYLVCMTQYGVCGSSTYCHEVHITPNTESVVQVEGGISISPNPFRGMLNINNASGAEVKLYDIIGRQVYDLTITNAHQQIDLAALHSGVYLYKIVKDGVVRGNGKLVKE